MGRRPVAALMAVALVAVACSDEPRLSPQADREHDVLATREPQLFASGTVMGGPDHGIPIEWDLEEIVGFTHAVSLTAATPTTVSVRSATRQGVEDPVWLVGATLIDDGPGIVFGGADGGVDSVVLVNGDGDQLLLELIRVPELDWYVAIEQLPAGWSSGVDAGVEVVALRAGVEVAREELVGLAE
ncbi:MAG: hypothetical protein OEV40_31010 [Acidimicrobiia bacterium]|nr:hypothetical protein [Acidimicrobiia bacterium]